jgi:RecA/RadA recombinase
MPTMPIRKVKTKPSKPVREADEPVAVSDEQTVENSSVNVPDMDVAALQQQIYRTLKLSTFEPEYKYWLDTGSSDLNGALGSMEKGMAYGKIYEISGPEHGGKTTIATILAGKAQRDGAGVGRIDFENSRDDDWDSKLGLDPSKVLNCYVKLLKGKRHNDDGTDNEKGKPSSVWMQCAEEVLSEAEEGMRLMNRKGFKKQYWFMDSAAAAVTAMAMEAGIEDQNMRTKVDRAQMFSMLLPRWTAVCANYNVMLVIINQLREKPGLAFGDPTSEPCGRALRHYSSVIARVRREKNGELRQGKKVIGLCSTIQNKKNKCGGGSVQGGRCCFKVLWDRSPAKITFMPVADKEE